MNNKKMNDKAVFQRLGAVLGYMAILLGVFFMVSGSWSHPFVWLYGGLGVVNAVILAALLWRSPGLMQERAQSGPNVKKWDRVLVKLQGVMTLFGLILSGPDFRFGWTQPIPAEWRWFGVAVLLVGNGLIAWAMRTNHFFSTYVRIQTDREHQVIVQGPYSLIRHPGYGGIILTLLGFQFMLGSWLGFGFITAAVGVIGYRTCREDQTLQTELEGYQAYVRRVRYRLIPGIW
jgi:protein-S-isoprenylcysteine O-methyltransferase Ste14